jgi:PAS domain S-box-containing protein
MRIRDEQREQFQTGARRRVRVRLMVPLLAATVLSMAALAAIVALTWHASASRDNEDRLDDVRTALNLLQDMPWRLEASGNVTPGKVTLTTVTSRMLAMEHAVQGSLDTLRRRSPVTELASVPGPLQANFDALNYMVGLVDHGQFEEAGFLVPATFRSHDAVVRALNRAGGRYRARAATALREATIGSVLIALALLSGFALFYRRAFRARAAAEDLAREVHHSKTHLEQAQRLASAGSWEWDEGQRRMTWSAEHARLHGWTNPSPPASPSAVLELIAPEDRERVRAGLSEALVEGKPIELEYRLREASGGRLIHVQATPIVDGEGQTTRMIGTSQDVTDRFRRAEAERANNAKNEFISKISHELRTPLNAILGFGQLMTMSELDERQRANVDHILSAGKHLLDLINELLDISRIESGDLRLAPEPVSVRAVIGETTDLVTPEAIDHELAVLAECGEEDLWVRADLQRLKQVLLNLLSNAVKYNHAGGYIGVRASRAGTDRVQIIVEDDGAGIDPTMMERLFSPFERLGAEQTSVEGTGLGLALSRGMIEAMGGRIEVRSELGQGTAFTIELESVHSPDAASFGWDAINLQPGSAAEPTRVLCIDDDPADFTVIEQVLRSSTDIELLRADTGAAGAKLACEQRIDLILLDLNLPDMGGPEVLARLKAGRATRVPVVILTDDSSSTQLDRVLSGGARAYLVKPLDVAELLRTIDELAVERIGAAA